jgi:hypothetical protein
VEEKIMATKKAVVKKTKKDLSEGQEAWQVTFVLIGTLKRVQLMYLRVGELLVDVRERKLYADLKHPDMETYARERLGLGRASLYNYLRIYDWVLRVHPEWLKPKAKGFIPDLSDIGDLMWLDEELARTNLSPARRALLVELQKKGMSGKLLQSEMRRVRKSGSTTHSGVKGVMASLKSVRARAAKLAAMSPEVLSHLDSAIAILSQDKAISVARLSNISGSHRLIS